MYNIKNKGSVLVKSIPVCFVMIFLATQSGAQTKASLVAAIRKDFQAINADKNLSKKTLSNEQFMKNMTDGGGELTGFYKKGSLVKIIEWIGLSYGNRTREFYFKKNNLFFVYEKFQSFVTNDSTGEMDHTSTTTSFECRYYFDREKLIEQKTSGKRILEDKPGDIVKELREAANENFKLLKKE